MSPCKLQKSLAMDNFGTDSAAHGVRGGGGGHAGGGEIGEGCERSAAGYASRVSEASKEGFGGWLWGGYIGGVLGECWGACLPSEQHERGRAASSIRGEVAGIILGVP